jgi:hypothetical protein
MVHAYTEPTLCCAQGMPPKVLDQSASKSALRLSDSAVSRMPGSDPSTEQVSPLPTDQVQEPPFT